MAHPQAPPDSPKYSACVGCSLKIMIPHETNMDSTQTFAGKKNSLIKFLLRKAAVVAVVTLIFGWLYAWASPWAFAGTQPAGFAFGMLHGAMMPLSLPSLVMGKDVPIYDPNNLGRLYKIGYICGVNICGIVFIGPIFWRPRGGPVT
jgi:hypothetical protein